MYFISYFIMHAIRHSQPDPHPNQSTRRASLLARGNRRRSHRAIAAETSAKLLVNLVLAIASGSALLKLLPYSLTQQAKLQEIRAEVSLVGNRVAQVQGDFDRNFDPQQMRTIMQEQSSRVDPQQRQVIWLTPAHPEAAVPPRP
jgi:hypothetical protein